MTRPPLIALVGPTAVGKTAVSLLLARRFSGEVISADSRQIYRGLDIGTDKVAPVVRAEVPHHLVDVVDPDEVFTLAQYQRAAYAAIDDVHGRGWLPLLVGGTGLYVRAVLDGLGIPAVPPDEAVRAELEQVAAAQGALALHARLHALDPTAAAAIDPRNVRRVVRALEVCLLAGVPISRLQESHPPPYRILRVGLTRPRAALYERIDRRVDTMIERGLEREVRQLLAAGYSPRLPALTGLGYSQMIRYVLGELDLAQAIAEIKQQTRRYVRQQGTWFRAGDARISWFDLEQETVQTVAAAVQAWLATETEANR